MTENDPILLYSRKRAADALSVSIRSVSYLIASGNLPTIRIGRKNLIAASALRAFAKKGIPTAIAA